jgi:tRNA(His) 5'-end guanylyltransferase
MNEKNNFIHIPYSELRAEAKRYEEASQSLLSTKVPVFVRVECKSFGAMVEATNKHYDDLLADVMRQTMLHLCEEMQGCVFAYLAHGEITAILTDYHKPSSVSWLNYDQQKICSEASSFATIVFSRELRSHIESFESTYDGNDKNDLLSAYKNIEYNGGRFNTTCFNVPEDRVCDMIYYRQLDARRTAIQSMGRYYFSRNEIMGKSNAEVISMLDDRGVSWNQLPAFVRIGSCCNKGVKPFAKKSKWHIDNEVPIICGNSSEYLQNIMDTVRDPEYYTEE